MSTKAIKNGNGANVFLLKLSSPLLQIIFLATTSMARFYTLDQLIEESQKNSIELQVAKKSIEHTEIEVQMSLSRYYPRIGVSAYLIHLFDQSAPLLLFNDHSSGSSNIHSATASVSKMNEFPLQIPGQIYGTEYHSSANHLVPALTLQQPLFLQGQVLYSVKMGRALQHMAVCEYESKKQGTIANTKKKFYKMLIEQERIKCKTEQQLYLEELHRLNLLEYKLGNRESIDTLHSQIAVEQGKLELLKAESGKVKTAEALILQCGIAESPKTFWIDDELPEPVFFISIEEAVARMHDNNSSLRQFKGAESIAKYKIDREKMKFLPQVYAGALYGRDIGLLGHTMLPRGKQKEFAGVFGGLTWELFSGLSTVRAIDLAKNEKEQLLLTQQMKADQIEFMVREKYQDILIAKQHLEILMRVIDLRKVALQQMRSRLNAGVQTELHVREAECALIEARLKYNEQIYLFLSAVIDFRLLIGSPA